ncbi:hypothetical protein G6038_10440 [Rhodococcus sp. 14C212]|nr:hypothetical protein [Rhodococcus sp. 14C212]
MRLAETRSARAVRPASERRFTDPAVKSASIVAGMLAGADRIDDLDVLRPGAMNRLFGGVRAPSTLGIYLRSFTLPRKRAYLQGMFSSSTPWRRVCRPA